MRKDRSLVLPIQLCFFDALLLLFFTYVFFLGVASAMEILDESPLLDKLLDLGAACDSLRVLLLRRYCFACSLPLFPFCLVLVRSLGGVTYGTRQTMFFGNLSLYAAGWDEGRVDIYTDTPIFSFSGYDCNRGLLSRARTQSFDSPPLLPLRRQPEVDFMQAHHTCERLTFLVESYPSPHRTVSILGLLEKSQRFINTVLEFCFFLFLSQVFH